MSRETTKERWFDVGIYRLAGEVATLSPRQDSAPAGLHCERPLAIARGQHAKSWELRAAKSMARHSRARSKRAEAGELLALAHGWFPEGADTLGLKQAALRNELSP